MKRKILQVLQGFLAANLAVNGFKIIDRQTNYSSELQNKATVEQIAENTQPRGNDFALIINSPGRYESQRLGFKDATREAYEALKSRGYKDENIIILQPENPSFRETTKGITARPSIQNFELAKKYLNRHLNEDSTLTVFYQGHHKRTRDNGKLEIGRDNLSSREFADYFKGIPGKKIFLLDTCYAGYIGKQISKLPDEKLVLCITDENHKGIAGFGRETWRKVYEGQSIRGAYKQALEENQERLGTKYNERISLGKGKNIFTEYSSGNVDLPNPSKEERQQSSSNLEKRVMNILILFAGLFSLLLFFPLTGNAIKEQTLTANPSLIHLILFLSIIGIFVILKFKSKNK